MPLNVERERAALMRSNLQELRERYVELFGERTQSRNKPWLVKRLLWRLQALAEGGLTERARRRAAELANDADLRLSPPRGTTVERLAVAPPRAPLSRDPRLPPPGTVLSRVYKGGTVQVVVGDDGFECQGEHYRSLTAAAKAITGLHVNGFAFFGLAKERAR